MELSRKELSGNRVLHVVLIFIITALVFTLTVNARRPYFNTLSEFNHQWLTGDTLKYSRNWYREGPLSIGFGMYVNPDSVEFPDLSSRNLYCSYPPGAVLPIYLLSEIGRSEPSVGLINAYDLFNHFMIALFLALTMYFFLLQLRLRRGGAFLLSLIPMLVILLTPAGMYWHQNVFFVDQAVILPITLLLFLEVIRKDVKNKRGRVVLEVLFWIIFFYGMLTDWLFFYFALAIFIKRIALGELGNTLAGKLKSSLAYWSPGIAAMTAFAIQLTALDGWGLLADKFMLRTAIGEEGKVAAGGFFSSFWLTYVSQGFGRIAVYLLWFSFAVVVAGLAVAIFLKIRGKSLKPDVKQVLAMASIIILPCFAQVYSFRNHSAIHHFSSLKMELPLAAVSFILVPILIYFLVRDYLVYKNSGVKHLCAYARADSSKSLMLLTLLPLLMASIYVASLAPRMKSLFPPAYSYIVSGFVEPNSSYEDVMFSSQYEIPSIPPQRLALSMKRIYLISSLEDIEKGVSGIEGDFRIVILTIDGVEAPQVPGMTELLARAYEKIDCEELHLYRITMKDFEAVLEGLRQ